MDSTLARRTHAHGGRRPRWHSCRGVRSSPPHPPSKAPLRPPRPLRARLSALNSRPPGRSATSRPLPWTTARTQRRHPNPHPPAPATRRPGAAQDHTHSRQAPPADSQIMPFSLDSPQSLSQAAEAPTGVPTRSACSSLASPMAHSSSPASIGAPADEPPRTSKPRPACAWRRGEPARTRAHRECRGAHRGRPAAFAA